MRRSRSRVSRNDSGSASIELLGALPYLALALIASLQLIFAVATVQATSAAARAGARTLSQGDGDPVVSAERAVPSWVVNRMDVQVTGGAQPSVQVSSSIPILFPGLLNGPSVTRIAWFDPEQGVAPWG